MDGIEEKNIIINGLKSVDGENCVGGISGSVGTASVAGLLNTTLGVAEYLGFNANYFTYWFYRRYNYWW